MAELCNSPFISTGASMVFKHLMSIAVADMTPDSELANDYIQ